MARTPHSFPGIIAVAAVAVLAAYGEATANHFILPCDVECTSARWTVTGSLNVPRVGHTATLLADGRVLVAGGENSDPPYVPLASAELYDPVTGAWTFTGSMSAPRSGHTATLLADGRVLVAGGTSGHTSPDQAHESAELFDPGTATWHPTGPMSVKRWGYAAVRLHDGSVLVAGGVNGEFLRRAERYDPGTGTWSVTGQIASTGTGSVESFPDGVPFAVGRYWHTMTLLDSGEVLLTGGTDSGDLRYTLSITELYDPRTGEWRRVDDAPAGGVFQPATLLPDGSVLLTSGYGSAFPGTGGFFFETRPDGSVVLAGGNAVFETAQRFDPGSKTWSLAPDLLVPRYDHTATTLASGGVLVAGGTLEFRDWSVHYRTLGETERFDPATATWQAAASLNVPRSGHTATLLVDGRVLVAGGNGSASAALASAELYGAPIASRQVVTPQAGGRPGRTP